MIQSREHNLLDEGIVEEAVRWRRDLHRHPELAFAEHRTSQFVAKKLAEYGLKVTTGIAGTGVVGTLSKGSSRKTIAIRADMDALPVLEQSNQPHASISPGVMHACGHDGHVAIALAAARACSELPDLNGTVQFIFQPAEENEGGAQRMVEEGLFDHFPCQAVYALHNWPSLPLGTMVARDNEMMAALGIFEIKLTGRGGHAAMPHECTDPMVAAAHLVLALQSIVSRNVEPLSSAVVSVTQIHGGDTWNVIPDQSLICGTTRWFDPFVGDLLEQQIRSISSGIAQSFGCSATLKYERRFPPTINDAAIARIVREVAAASPNNLEIVESRPSMAAEDFAFMLEQKPGCYFWLGSADGSHDAPLHSPRFDFNDALIPRGIALWRSLVTKELA